MSDFGSTNLIVLAVQRKDEHNIGVFAPDNTSVFGGEVDDLAVTLGRNKLRKFVSKHIKDGAWKVVMQFVAGLLVEKQGQSTDIFSDLLP